MKRSTFSAKITGRWLRWIYVLCYFKINKIRPTEMHNKLCKSCDMFEDKCVWSALYPISNHSHIRQLQFATHVFSQQVLQQAVQISIRQCNKHGELHREILASIFVLPCDIWLCDIWLCDLLCCEEYILKYTTKY